VQQILEKMGKLEQEKEHWMLEAQLAKIKLEKETYRIAELVKNPGKGQEADQQKENALIHRKDSSSDVSAASLVPDQDSREVLIKNHYMTRIADLTTQLQLADSKSVHFHAECRALAKRLALAEKSNQSLTEDTKSASQSISRLQ
ncbi:hypothetical protein AB205_0157240, partial [Aquarana catesbeiana]